MSSVYTSNIDLDIMLKDDVFKKMVQLIVVNDDEIALKYVGNNFESVLEPGRYFVWKGIIDFEFKILNISDVFVPDYLSAELLSSLKLKPYVQSFEVASFEAGLLYVEGEFVKNLSQGKFFYWNNAKSVEVKKADLRQTPLEISGQEMLTKDKAALRINFYAQYEVVNVENALQNVKDYEKQLYLNVQLALREFVGTLTLDEILEKKEQVSDYVIESLKQTNKTLGVKLNSAGIRDIILPGEIKEIMNKVLVATKQAQANTITRREETAATRSLLNTAKLMGDNDMLFKLKEMEYVEKIAEKVGEISLSGGDQMMKQLTGIFTK